MSTVAAPLTHLFVAVYEDGEQFFQNPVDVSLTDPARSAFYDVDLSRLEAFVLVRQEDGMQFEVNLKTGLFAVGSEAINLAPQNFVPVNPLELIFFREVRCHRIVRATVNEDGKPVETFEDGDPYISAYVIGWKTTDRNGAPVERTLAVT